MSWQNSFERMTRFWERQEKLRHSILSFGNDFLDLAMRGIFLEDMVLVGASSGAGKTQFLMNLALANVLTGKKVHFIALEAYEGEIEDRIKYRLTAKRYFKDPDKPYLSRGLNYQDFVTGVYRKELDRYREDVVNEFTSFTSLNTKYKSDAYTVDHLVQDMLDVSAETDLIIVDHVHYFDFDHDNENRALREIAKTVRTICQVIQKPVVFAAHLRKRDRRFLDLVPGIDEFHGSSDLTKIATKVITLSRGQMIDNLRNETYIRIPKCRMDGSVTRYVAKLIYNYEQNGFENSYQIGRLVNNDSEFEPLLPEQQPFWFRNRLRSV